MATIIKSISLSIDLYNLAKKYKISASEAARVGFAVLLSEAGEDQYLNKVTIGRRINALAKIINDQQKKIEEFTTDVLEKK